MSSASAPAFDALDSNQVQNLGLGAIVVVVAVRPAVIARLVTKMITRVIVLVLAVVLAVVVYQQLQPGCRCVWRPPACGRRLPCCGGARVAGQAGAALGLRQRRPEVRTDRRAALRIPALGRR